MSLRLMVNSVPPPGTKTRLKLASVVLCLLMVFGVARWLTPDPRGFGTHRQLGLPECGFFSLTGIRCPQCGLTTSFCLLVRGCLSEAVTANPSGMILAVLMVIVMVWSLGVVATGRWLITAHPGKWLMHGTLAFLLLNGWLWLVRTF